jgi:hypothetical protein
MAYTMQGLFDASVLHVFKQGKPAAVRGIAMYRTPDGCRCGIGGILPDALYNPMLEHYKASGCMRRLPSLREHWRPTRLPPGFSDDEFDDFMDELQNCHDEAYHYPNPPTDSQFLVSFYVECMKFAERYCLDPATLATCM